MSVDWLLIAISVCTAAAVSLAIVMEAEYRLEGTTKRVEHERKP